MTGDFLKAQWRILIMASLLAIILLGLWLWHNYTSPQTVWNDMLKNNLTARSVTKKQSVSAHGAKDIEAVRIQFGPHYSALSRTTITNSSGSVTTDTLVTPNAAYIRYADITDLTKKNDYSQLENVWAKAGNDSDGQELRQVFNNSILDISAAPVLPVGYVAPVKRAELLQYLKTESVFTPDYKTVKSEVINGRKVYTYNVNVKLAPYLRMMQEFASVYGLKDLQNLDPNDYQSNNISLSVSADKLSHEMVRISSNALDLDESYTDYGLPQAVQIPTKTISVSQLQSRLAGSQ